MKKFLFTIFGTLFLFGACSKNEIPKIEQNPYRTIVEYTPGTTEMTVPGTITADADYSSWLTFAQTGDKVTFSFRRNTTGLIRRAEFTIAGNSQKAVLNQKEHSLDASLKTIITEMDMDEGEVSFSFSWETAYPDDYLKTWGYVVSNTSDISEGKDYPQTTPVEYEGNEFSLKGLKKTEKYYIWTYVVSTENDKVYSNMVAVLPPIHMTKDQDLQKVIDAASEYQEIMVPGGMTCCGPIKMNDKNKNKIVSGGWNEDFTEQSMENLTILDGRTFAYGFVCAADDDFNPLNGFVEISYFDIQRCKGDHGSAVHACGGPISIHHCYVHDNDCEKGAIGTREENYSTYLTVYNCIVADNRASGHGAAFGFGDGASYEDQVEAVLVNNLIVNNVSTKNDGYCSTFLCYNNTDLIFVNNTVVGNKNFEEYGGEYPGQNLRGNVRSLFANNIMVGNLTAKNTSLDSAVYKPIQCFLGLGGGKGTLAYNVYEGGFTESSNAKFIDNYLFDAGFDIKTVLTDPANGNYSPCGVAFNGGTLGEIEYMETRDSSPTIVDIAALLEEYDTDLAGNPRVVGGKVSCGCFQQ